MARKLLDETGLAELWALIKAKDAEAVSDRAKIATGSYSGTGVYGSSNPNSLTFEFVPKFIVIKPATSGYIGFFQLYGLNSWYTEYGYLQGDSLNGNDRYAKLEGNTVSWYSASGTTQQLNQSLTYNYLAIG